MNLKIKDAVFWGRLVSVFGFVFSGLTLLSCVGIPIGILGILAFVKLNNATDELKKLSLRQGEITKEEYEDVIATYGKFYKMLGIGSIVYVALMTLLIIFYVILVIWIFSFGFSSYY